MLNEFLVDDLEVRKVRMMEISAEDINESQDRLSLRLFPWNCCRFVDEVHKRLELGRERSMRNFNRNFESPLNSSKTSATKERRKKERK
jgi:hypothetical protein